MIRERRLYEPVFTVDVCVGHGCSHYLGRHFGNRSERSFQIELREIACPQHGLQLRFKLLPKRGQTMLGDIHRHMARYRQFPSDQSD